MAKKGETKGGGGIQQKKGRERSEEKLKWKFISFEKRMNNNISPKQTFGPF
jgi:hypothetical protein